MTILIVDDLVVAGSDMESHLKHFIIVFSKLRGANLKLHPNRCQMMLPELKYLGHIFSVDG